MKYGIKISDRDIKEIFEKVFNLKVRVSSIVGFRDQLKRQALALYKKLKQALKSGEFIHVDETGWRVDGENRQLFCL